MRLLRGPRTPGQAGEPVVATLVGQGRRTEQCLDDVQCLGHSLDARSARIEGKSGRVVLALQPTSAQAELESTVGEQVDGRDFLGEHCGMSEVVVVHEAPDA